MNQSFIISAIVFITVMAVLHIVKNIIIRENHISPEVYNKIHNRWLISTVIGLVILYILYGRAGP